MEKRTDTGVLKELGFSLLEEGKSLRVRADGYSMYPFIRPGSLITIEPYAESDVPAEGEIVAWKRGQTLIVHRLVAIRKEGTEFISRGDSCMFSDAPLVRDQLAGRVLKVEDAKGKIRTGAALISKPCYLYNRTLAMLITLLIRIRRKLMKIK